MVSLLAAVTFLLGPWAHAAFAAHAGFHVQFPWMTRGPNPKTRPELDRYNPFCSMLHSLLGPVALNDTEKGR